MMRSRRCQYGLQACLGLGAIAWAMAAVVGAEDSGGPRAGDQAVVPEPDDWGRRTFWRTTNDQPVSAAWQFADGEIVLETPGKGGSIVSPPLPAHFELSWQWQIEKGVNSGLKYRVRRFGPALFGNQYLGLEYQIIDSPPGDTSIGSTAAIYGLVGPTADKILHPPGMWNTSRVVAVGDRVEHFLNGKFVASARTVGPAWETAVALSKFSGSSGFGQPRSGDRVMLTDHGGRVRYRGFHFEPRLPPPADGTAGMGPFLANGSRNGWADQTSIVIWSRTTRWPTMLMDGRTFVAISTAEAGRLSKVRDPAALLAAQLPAGATLDEMQGACPGAAGRVRLSYYPEQQRHRIRHAAWITTAADQDFTAQWKLDGLKADTRYVTVIEAQTPDGEPSAVMLGGFRTPPPRPQAAPLSFCITTCHDFIRRDDGAAGHKIYRAMKQLAPDFVVHAGDIEYYDKPDPWGLTKELMRFKWSRLFALPSNRDFYARTTSYFIKDDHDTLADDCWPGQTYGAVTFAEGAGLFNNEQFPSRNPRYAAIRWGQDLEIWLLEGRDDRSPNTMPDGPEKSILGQRQKTWLFETLERSDASFKLVFSPTPIIGPDRAGKRDNHANDGFDWEGAEVRERLAAVPGVIVCCGDRHWQYASVDPGTGLWEFGCGPGSEHHQLGWKPGDERPVHRFLRVAGGFLSGELRTADGGGGGGPTLTLRHRSVTGEPQSQFVFPQSWSEPAER
jgi:alkaline phosphatase D